MTSATDRDDAAYAVSVRIARTAAMIALVAIAARFVGLLRVVTQATAIGFNPLGDTYVTANRIPNIVFDVVAGGALSSLVIPVLARPIGSRDRAATQLTVSALLTWTVLILVPLSIVGMLVARPLMALLLAGVADDESRRQQVQLGSRMLVVFMPQVLLYGVGIVLTGVLQAHRRFLAPAIAPLLSSVVVIAAYLAFAAQADGERALGSLSRAEELTLSLGTTLGVAALTLPLLLPTRRLGLRFRPALRLPGEAGGQLRRLAAAGATALAAQQLATAVVIVLANRVPGGLVVYEFAWTVFLVPWAVLAVPIATSAFPDLTESAAAGDDAAYTASLASALRAVLLAMVVAASLLVATSGPLAELVFALAPPTTRGGVEAGDLARAIAAFAPGLVGYGAVALLTRAAYARHAGRAAATATAAGFAMSAALSLLLAAVVSDRWLVAAFGAGNAVGMSVAAMLLLRWARRETGSAAMAGAARLTVAAVGAGCVAAVAGLLVSRGLLSSAGDEEGGALLALLAATGIASMVLAAAAVRWARPEAARMLARLRSAGRNASQ